MLIGDKVIIGALANMSILDLAQAVLKVTESVQIFSHYSGDYYERNKVGQS